MQEYTTVIKLKRKHFKNLKSYGDFFLRVGIQKLSQKHGKLKIQDFEVAPKTAIKIKEAIREFHKNYFVLDEKNLKKEKDLRGQLTRFEETSIAMDYLNYAPEINTELEEGYLYLEISEE